MKKVILLGMLLSFLCVKSQSFPGKEVQLLMGKELKVKELEEYMKTYGYKNFYISSKLKRKYKSKSKYGDSEYSELVNKVFKVIAIEEYKDYDGKTKSMLKIENAETGTLYYKYNEEYENSFEFVVVGGLDFPDGFYCKEIKETKDKFSDKVILRSPYKEPISFTKVIENGEKTIYMSIDVFGRTINVNKKGATILFENKEKMEFANAKISSKVSRRGGGYKYSIFVALSDEQIVKLSENVVTDVKLFIYEKEIKNGKKIKEYLKCLTK